MTNFPVITADAVKKAALAYGADLVGIGSIDRWSDAPAENHPRTIMPRARSVICIAFRLHRGLHRGIEEGTYYSAYSLTGFIDLNHYVVPVVQRRLASFIEDCGYEAAPVMYLSNYLGADVGEPARNADGTPKPKPDIFFNFRIAGALCGVGQVGLSRLLLSEKFGPAQRVYFIITDAELEPDPVIDDICDGCGLCARTCPANALSLKRRDDVNVTGVTTIRRYAIDFTKCAIAHSMGGLSPFAPPDVSAYARNIVNGSETETADGHPRPPHEEISAEIAAKVGYTLNARENFRDYPALCGECVRSCLGHLEKTGRLTLKFHHPFRK
jgi:ferredoxin